MNLYSAAYNTEQRRWTEWNEIKYNKINIKIDRNHSSSHICSRIAREVQVNERKKMFTRFTKFISR